MGRRVVVEKQFKPLHLDALVAPPGSTVVLRCPDRLTEAQRAKIRGDLEEWTAEGKVRFVWLDGPWEACVIGVPE